MCVINYPAAYRPDWTMAAAGFRLHMTAYPSPVPDGKAMRCLPSEWGGRPGQMMIVAFKRTPRLGSRAGVCITSFPAITGYRRGPGPRRYVWLASRDVSDLRYGLSSGGH